jgi:hypothetical protein
MPASGGLQVNTNVFTANSNIGGPFTMYQRAGQPDVQYWPGPVGLTTNTSNPAGGLEVNTSVFVSTTYTPFVGTGYQNGNDPSVQYWSGPI